VATNDSHYICEDDCLAQDVMVCIQTGKSINDPNRLKFQTNQFFVKSAEEMGKVFQGYERAAGRTLGDRRALQPAAGEVRENPFPRSTCPPGETHRQLL
jgi:DNA polymerase III subunit alpha